MLDVGVHGYRTEVDVLLNVLLFDTGLFLNLESSILTKLASQKFPEIYLPLAPSTVIGETYWHIKLFMWVPGIQTLVLMFIQQALYSLSHATSSLGIFSCHYGAQTRDILNYISFC